MGAMQTFPDPLDLASLKVRPLAERESRSRLEHILVDPGAPPRACAPEALAAVHAAAQRLAAARQRQASVILMYGAHLVKNGALAIVNRLLTDGWITHLATNGAGTIHDWELSFLGRTEKRAAKRGHRLVRRLGRNRALPASWPCWPARCAAKATAQPGALHQRRRRDPARPRGAGAIAARAPG